MGVLGAATACFFACRATCLHMCASSCEARLYGQALFTEVDALDSSMVETAQIGRNLSTGVIVSSPCHGCDPFSILSISSFLCYYDGDSSISLGSPIYTLLM